MNWFYVEQGKQNGPLSDEQFNEMVANGKITPDTLVWHEGMANWVPCREVKGGGVSTAPGGEQGSQAVCSECGKLFPIDETIRYGDARVCASCKPIFLQKLQEGAALNTGALRYAGFWIRFGARILDGLIVGVPLMILFFVLVFSQIHPSTLGHSGAPPDLGILPTLLQFAFVFVQMGYEVFFLGKYGATPGKMACGLRVVTSDGGKISYGRAVGRFFAQILSGLICYIGYIIAAFDNPQKRALHDHICNTRVVYK
ncbi:MAG TPA: RDD family protein [Candidatus Acidoferrum sp.]|jgi:uncharacterized RDD family membrane protein YckC|nr:RDD family protein [Candidatus Acidoferrum sp.]